MSGLAVCCCLLSTSGHARVYKKSFIMDDSSMMELQINALVIIHYCDLQLFSNLYKPRHLASHELLPSSSTPFFPGSCGEQRIFSEQIIKACVSLSCRREKKETIDLKVMSLLE